MLYEVQITDTYVHSFRCHAHAKVCPYKHWIHNTVAPCIILQICPAQLTIWSCK